MAHRNTPPGEPVLFAYPQSPESHQFLGNHVVYRYRIAIFTQQSYTLCLKTRVLSAIENNGCIFSAIGS